MDQNQINNALAIFLNTVNTMPGLPKEKIIEIAAQHTRYFYEVIEKIESDYQTLPSASEQPAIEAKSKPVVQFTKDMIHPDYNPNTAITDDYIHCAICMKPFRSLYRHLQFHNILESDYKRVLGLDNNTLLMSKNAAAKAQANIAKTREKSPQYQKGIQNKDLKSSDNKDNNDNKDINQLSFS